MNRNEKALAGGGTPTKADMVGQKNNNTKPSLVASILKPGAENAMTQRQIKAFLGLSDERFVRKLIESERIAGAVILSDEGGYYLPSLDPEIAMQELKRYAHRCDARLKTNRLALRSAKLALARLQNIDQLILADVDEA